MLRYGPCRRVKAGQKAVYKTADGSNVWYNEVLLVARRRSTRTCLPFAAITMTAIAMFAIAYPPLSERDESVDLSRRSVVVVVVWRAYAKDAGSVLKYG